MKIVLSSLFAAIVSVIFLTDRHAPVLQEPQDEYQVEKGRENNIFAEDNENCLVCHGEQYYELSDTSMGKSVRRFMPSNYYVDRDEYYQSNHWSFGCLDCHNYDFEEFPHPTSARLEEPFHCNDCHGFDEQYAHYHFGQIRDEYEQSVHYEIEGFTCWKCHDPHSYEITIRNTDNLQEAILYNNNICLECHANYDQFQLLSDREEINIVESHAWLPNQSAHFSSVRCIECHTEISDSILVAHKLLPADKSVKRCTECHTSDSRLLASLYKFRSQEFRSEVGFLNGVILNQSYVIGANRNVILNILSVVIFGAVILVIAVHVFFRVLKRNK
ncbi:MAG TPA: hypothetical protein VJ877_07065 [Bacteroidales bacterium]|nr:hypothetical protein [Bacteroidales bacterium]